MSRRLSLALIGNTSAHVLFAHSCEAVAAECGARVALLVSRHSDVVPWSMVEDEHLSREVTASDRRRYIHY